jgi:hypothetical protein
MRRSLIQFKHRCLGHRGYQSRLNSGASRRAQARHAMPATGAAVGRQPLSGHHGGWQRAGSTASASATIGQICSAWAAKPQAGLIGQRHFWPHRQFAAQVCSSASGWFRSTGTRPSARGITCCSASASVESLTTAATRPGWRHSTTQLGVVHLHHAPLTGQHRQRQRRHPEHRPGLFGRALRLIAIASPALDHSVIAAVRRPQPAAACWFDRRWRCSVYGRAWVRLIRLASNYCSGAINNADDSSGVR